MKPGKRNRRAAGAAMIMTVSLIYMLATMAVLAAVCAGNAGFSYFWREKLRFATRQALACYMAELSWSAGKFPTASAAKAEAKIKASVNAALMKMGMPPAEINFQTNGNSVTVNTHVQGLALLKADGLPFPTTIDVSDSLSSNFNDSRPDGLCSIGIAGGSAVTLPTYGRFIMPWSNGAADPRSAWKGVACFYSATVPYDQFDIRFLSDDAYSDNVGQF
ncbi:MAG: hypothetical protein K2X27_07175 [Candidatus Obscuribacterales bacterium]|nr:hypothetical protein [Candidatus Obscuribacterales bacterium]